MNDIFIDNADSICGKAGTCQYATSCPAYSTFCERYEPVKVPEGTEIVRTYIPAIEGNTTVHAHWGDTSLHGNAKTVLHVENPSTGKVILPPVVKMTDTFADSVIAPILNNITQIIEAESSEFIGLRIKDLPGLVAAYVGMIEKERTNRLCKCEWIIHPDDVDKPEGKRRVRKGEATLDCPVHTKEGFLLGFHAWVWANAD